MNDNLYETSQFTNPSAVLSYSPGGLGPPQYFSVQSSTLSPASPLFPAAPNQHGLWDYNQFSQAPPPFASQEVALGVGQNLLLHLAPLNQPGLQRLDSFSKAFPSKNLQLLGGESGGEKSSSGHIPDHHDRILSEHLAESPGFHGQMMSEQPGFQQPEGLECLHGLHQHHQPKSPSPWLHQHDLTSPLSSFQRQKAAFPGTPSPESHKSLQSPTFMQTHEQQNFHGLNLLYQDQQMRSLGQQSCVFGDQLLSLQSEILEKPEDLHYPGRRISEVQASSRLASYAFQWSETTDDDVKAASPHYRADTLQMRDGPPSTMRCTVCQREFRSLPALNGHMRSHGGLRAQTPTLKPVSSSHLRVSTEALPQQREEPAPDPRHQTETPGTSCEAAAQLLPSCTLSSVEKQPIDTPPDAATPTVTPQYCSRLRKAGGPYTPPPMLRPDRPGSGLYCASVTEEPENRTDLLMHATPHINVGEAFQAKIPELCCPSITEDDARNLLWSPRSLELESLEQQQKVEALLKMSCSSVLPGGGVNTEYVLHCLFQSRGDMMKTLEKLLTPSARRRNPSDYHYAGSDSWTLQEKRQMSRALLTHHKDFHRVQKVVKSKSVSQCVEFYYIWKKELRRSVTGDWTIGVAPKPHPHGRTKPQEAGVEAGIGPGDPALLFPCSACGKVFLKVKSRNAHMKSHRQMDDARLRLPVPKTPVQEVDGRVTSLPVLKSLSYNAS